MTTNAWSPFTISMASGGTLTSALDLQGNWTNVYLQIPPITNTVFAIKASDSATGTFARVKHPAINSSTLTANDYLIASTATNCVVPIPVGLRFVKVETEIAVADGATFKVLCGGGD